MTEVIEHPNAATHAPAPAAASPLDLPAEQFQAGLDRRGQNRRALLEWVRGSLVAGVDYGQIPTKRGPSKPSLWKPGAEKICGMLGITVHYPTLQDYEQAALRGVQLAHIIVRCELRDSAGNVVADGVGARALKQDNGDLNKALKMAEKSAHIDATLRMAGLSEVFTQDLEDMPGAVDSQPDRSSSAPGSHDGHQTISEPQRKRLEARIQELGLDRERVKSWLVRATRGRVEHFRDLTPGLYERLDGKLDGWARGQDQAAPVKGAE